MQIHHVIKYPCSLLFLSFPAFVPHFLIVSPYRFIFSNQALHDFPEFTLIQQISLMELFYHMERKPVAAFRFILFLGSVSYGILPPKPRRKVAS